MANTETIRERRGEGKELLPVSKEEEHKCEFENYDALLLMSETAKIRKLITKRGTLEILIPLCCPTNPVRYKKFRQVMKGFSTRTLTGSSLSPDTEDWISFDTNTRFKTA